MGDTVLISKKIVRKMGTCINVFPTQWLEENKQFSVEFYTLKIKLSTIPNAYFVLFWLNRMLKESFNWIQRTPRGFELQSQ